MADERQKKFIPKSGTSEINTALRHEAHRRLDQLLDSAEGDSLHGLVSIEVRFAAGKIDMVRRNLSGTDRSCV